MAQEFYLKAQALHEEFQKRELHYLNTERKLNSSILWKKDHNLPLQEYLQRINQREKETDEICRNIMKQMEEIDRHTDVLSLKLEKLRILQTSVTTAMTSSWLQRLGPSIVSNYQTPGLQSLHSTQNVFSLSTRSVSTQTESGLYCGKCNSPILINNQSSHLLENFPSLKIFSGMNNKSETMQSSNLQSDSSSLFNETQNVARESIHTEHLFMPSNDENVLEENSKCLQVKEKHSAQKPFFSRESNERRNTLESEMQINEDLIPDSTHVYIPKNLEKSNVTESSADTKNSHIKTTSAESHKDTFVSKSDVDSINNEFDFLESDTANKPDKIKTAENLENIKSPVINISIGLDKVSSSVEKHPRESKLNSKSKKQEKRVSDPNLKLNAVDDESGTSGGYSGFHSPHLSVASDSDGAYENGSPVTASAAYQALLGNTVLPKKAPKNFSGSESEDEAENALASAVQKNNAKPKSSLKQKKDETSLQQAVTKPADKVSKLSSTNKSQSKLSKNTRKVLGLDTSSGSDVEIAVKPPAGEKIDEDSDEFGFFD